MDNDRRDPRDWPSADGPDEPQDEPRDPSADPQPGPGWDATDAGSEARPEGERDASEPTGWPAEDAGDPSGAPDPEETRTWPTEPPSAGSGGADTWPTSAPERSDDGGGWSTRPEEPAAAANFGQGAPGTDEPAAEPSWPEDRAPVEAEAYPSAPAPTPAPQDTGMGAGAAAGLGAGAAAGAGAHGVPDAQDAIGESTRCPRCGTENRPGLAFCRNCGQRLVAAGVATTVERPGAPEGTQACPRCGTHNRAGVAFCQNCGANLRGTAPGYVPPAVAEDEPGVSVTEGRAGAVLGPVVLLIGMVGLITGYLLPFLSDASLYERAFGSGGYGAAFWNGYPEMEPGIADAAYFGLAAPVPVFALLLAALAVAGFMRARPGGLQPIGLIVALVWSAGLIVLFLLVELAGNWGGDLVGLLRLLTPAGIILFLASLIVLIGVLTRFGRS